LPTELKSVVDVNYLHRNYVSDWALIGNLSGRQLVTYQVVKSAGYN
jgi:hypothetical protein